MGLAFTACTNQNMARFETLNEPHILSLSQLESALALDASESKKEFAYESAQPVQSSMDTDALPQKSENESTSAPIDVAQAAEQAQAVAIKKAKTIKKAKEAVMRKIELSKVKGMTYIECVFDGKYGDKITAWPPPSSPPFTTWSGLMLCDPDSSFAPRLLQKCGGVYIMEDGKEVEATEEKKEEKAAAILGFWTAPNDWREMLTAKDGIEDPLPCSSKDYPKPSFLPSWA